MLSKISPDHLRRVAVVYIRQSSITQLTHNLESQRRQYGLVNHAKGLGFDNVEIIDDDLGRSGSGLVQRPGFQRLVAMVCEGRVGAVLCIEASRLARNGRDWHHLIELCGLVGALVVDPDGVYDPQLINDRLLLGLKGTMSEFELNLLRQRSLEAARQKARRGELQFSLPVGYCWTHHGKIEMEPDRRIREAIFRVFDKFRELGSMRQVLLWFRGEQIFLPVTSYNEFGRTTLWRLPIYKTIRYMLVNPTYAGAYAFGKTCVRTQVVNGRAHRTQGHAKPREEWMVLIRDHHPGYISWEEYERNQMIIAENAHSKSGFHRKAGRGGRGLLSGLLRCGRCSRMLHVVYVGNQRQVVRYFCRGAHVNHGTDRCISFGGLKADRVVSAEVLNAISGSAIQSALKAAESSTQQTHQRRESLNLEVEQARYEARLAVRRYEAVDPENRLVAAELEARWNAALQRVRQLEKTLQELDIEPQAAAVVDRDALLRLAEDLPTVWNAPTTDMRLKQRIVHILIQEIVANVDDSAQQVVFVIHWTGGRHSELRFAKNKTGHHSRVTQMDAIEVIRQMSGCYSDKDIASTLNRLGMQTGAGNTWQEHRVHWARRHHGLSAYDPNKKDVSLLTLEQAAAQLGISKNSVRKLIQENIVPAKQIVACAPWQIPVEAVMSSNVIKAAQDFKKRRRGVPRASKVEDDGALFSGLWRGGAE
jgi:DNA invertase Pin-like site-specific DNA recombinase